jgi:hypothetical protein
MQKRHFPLWRQVGEIVVGFQCEAERVRRIPLLADYLGEAASLFGIECEGET